MDDHGRHRHIAVAAPQGIEAVLYGWKPASDTLLFDTGLPPD
jgi:hypothetical protein